MLFRSDFYKASQNGQPHIYAFQTFSDLNNMKYSGKNIVIEQNNICAIVHALKRNTIETQSNGATGLNPVEMKSIGLFVQFSQALGQPRSVAEIYGLLFISHLPLSLDEIIARLNMSRGSGSQGLNYLLDLGAVRTVYVSGQRRVHYEAVAELRNLAGRFLHQQILVQIGRAHV